MSEARLGAVCGNMKLLSATFLLMIHIGCTFAAVLVSDHRNDEPIVGVLAQELSSSRHSGSSYIAASYVKYLEMAGARVVPVKLLIPGGGANLISSGYAKAAKIFYELAVKANSQGDYFPIWGTCLGFEELSYLTSKKFLLSKTNTTGLALPLIFTNGSRESRMFKGFPEDVLRSLASEPITENSHEWSLTLEEFPFYGTQWHPEKNAYEWTKPYIPQSPSAIKMMFFMADFFVNEARKSFHRFSSEKEKAESLIYNYSPVYTGKNPGTARGVAVRAVTLYSEGLRSSPASLRSTLDR
ncbi:gamma-glutamyl hydrolase-like, partial [Scleropages formosus]